jgi:putative glutamine amidotransferase
VAGRPVIGICSAIETARWGAWEAVCDLVPRTYSLAVQRAGGIALLLPPDDISAEAPDELLDLLDGLVLAGGADVDPGSYGARPHAETGATRPERDRFELALGHRALERDLPMLGICRGMQMLNVASGGTIEQHLPERIGSEAHRHTPGGFSDHSVRIASGTLTERVVGGGRAEVRSHHHQGVGELGEGVEVTGWSDGDEVIEAIELPGRRFALGVLWHPEQDEQSRVIEALVAEARGRGSPTSPS